MTPPAHNHEAASEGPLDGNRSDIAREVSLPQSHHRAWNAVAIVLPIAALFVSATLVNRVLPEPDSVDFRTLNRVCLLMDQRGWEHCVNHNWGFALPLVTTLVTRLTGDLLIAQRIVSAAFALLALILAERIMTRIFNIQSVRTKTLLLLWMSVSPWMLEALVSVHLDIASIAFLLAAVLLLRTRRRPTHLLGGLFASMACWFRFHFLIAALLYIPLVAMHRRGDRGLRRSGWAMAGVVLGFLVPTVLCLIALGTPAVSNSKQAFMIDCVYEIGPPSAPLAEFRDCVPYTIEFYEKLAQLSWPPLLRGIAWGHIVKRFIRICLRPAFVLLLAALGLQILSPGPTTTREEVDHLRYSILDRIGRISRYPSTLIIVYVILVLLPFVFIRGHTPRLEASFFLLAFPILAALTSDKTARYKTGLVLALFLVSVGMSREQLAVYRTRNRRLTARSREILSVVPEEVLRDRPERVLCTVEFYNPYARYRQCSPALFGGWCLLSAPMREEFGVIDVTRMHEDRTHEPFEYIVLARQPGSNWASQVCERYDKAMLDLEADYTQTDTLIVLHRDRDSQ
jgi:hypothetical protein